MEEFTFRAELVHRARTSILIKSVLAAQFVLELGEVLHDGGAVADVCISHALHLNGILLDLNVSDGVFGIDSDRLADSVKMRVACTKMDTQFGS